MKRNKVEEMRNYLRVHNFHVSDAVIADTVTRIQTESGLNEFERVVEEWRRYLQVNPDPTSNVDMMATFDYILSWARKGEEKKEIDNETK